MSTYIFVVVVNSEARFVKVLSEISSLDFDQE